MPFYSLRHKNTKIFRYLPYINKRGTKRNQYLDCIYGHFINLKDFALCIFYVLWHNLSKLQLCFNRPLPCRHTTSFIFASYLCSVSNLIAIFAVKSTTVPLRGAVHWRKSILTFYHFFNLSLKLMSDNSEKLFDMFPRCLPKSGKLRWSPTWRAPTSTASWCGRPMRASMFSLCIVPKTLLRSRPQTRCPANILTFVASASITTGSPVRTSWLQL